MGQSEFNQILREERNRAVRKRIAVSYNLNPLHEQETEKYINHRLNIAGAAQELFTAEAIRKTFHFSGGYPRLINVICDHALLTGFSKGLKRIDDGVIADCKKDLFILSDPNKLPEEDEYTDENAEVHEFSESPDKAQGGKRIWIYLSVALVFTIVGYLMFTLGWINFWSDEIKESPPSLNKGISEKESLKSEDVLKRDFDNKKASEISQVRTTAVKEKLDETRKKTVLSSIQSTGQTADPKSSNNIILLPERKTIIQFEHDSMKIPEQAHTALNQIVKFNSSNPTSEIIVEGYTDSWGDYVYNKNLSKWRADVVKQYLVNKGISGTKIETVGMGPENPIASNETFEGRKLNRRIEIRIKAK